MNHDTYMILCGHYNVARTLGSRIFYILWVPGIILRAERQRCSRQGIILIIFCYNDRPSGGLKHSAKWQVAARLVTYFQRNGSVKATSWQNDLLQPHQCKVKHGPFVIKQTNITCSSRTRGYVLAIVTPALNY